jgi:hypothetical protein
MARVCRALKDFGRFGRVGVMPEDFVLVVVF